MNAQAFAPLHTLAAQLLPHALEPAEDGAHDLSHLQRVWSNVRRIAEQEGGDLHVLLAATLLHDCVAVEKNSPLRSQASRLAAVQAGKILASLHWAQAPIDAVAHAIEAHSFSAAIEPISLEAKILQDADRLDSLGALGVARTFYIAGRMGSALYDPLDPRAAHREYDDNAFAWTTSRPNCCTSPAASRPRPARTWRRFGISACNASWRSCWRRSTPEPSCLLRCGLILKPAGTQQTTARPVVENRA